MYKLPEGMKSLSSCDKYDSINSRASKLSSTHKSSHKSKPKIRIIHIIAPEIIKTDAKNFRDLVQRLTGRHAADDEGKGSSCRSKINVEPQEQAKKDEHQVYGGGGFVEDFGELPVVFPLDQTVPTQCSFW